MRVNSSAVAGSLLMAGLYLLYVELFVDPIIMMPTIVVGVFVTSIGAACLFTDLIAPMIRSSNPE
jgi:multisubunit Na+/H+ antiporter MnhC subunit